MTIFHIGSVIETLSKTFNFIFTEVQIANLQWYVFQVMMLIKLAEASEVNSKFCSRYPCTLSGEESGLESESGLDMRFECCQIWN